MLDRTTPSPALLDTNVIAHLLLETPAGARYAAYLDGRIRLITPVALRELSRGPWSAIEIERLTDRAAARLVAEPDSVTRGQIAELKTICNVLGFSGGVGDIDLEIIAQARRYDAVFVSHDRLAVRAARAARVLVHTELIGMERYYAIDDRALRRGRA